MEGGISEYKASAKSEQAPDAVRTAVLKAMRRLSADDLKGFRGGQITVIK